MRALRLMMLAGCLAGLALPAGAGAATITNTLAGTLSYNAAPGEANTAVIADQGAGVYFVGDQNPAVMVTPGALCVATPAGPLLPPGFLCTNPTATGLVLNLDDGNDTGVINSTGPAGTIVAGTGNDLLVGGTQNDTFTGGDGDDSVAYVGIDAAGITRTAPVDATLPAFPAGPATTGNGAGAEDDTINNDVEGLIGGNGNDTLTGNDGPNTLAGAAPVGTPGVDTEPAGVDALVGNGGDDTILGGDSGTISGDAGSDQLVGGRSDAATTTINGGADDDTIVSGLGDDDINGGAGANTLAYSSVYLGALTIVDRGTNGVTAELPDAAGITPGGQTGGNENDLIHDDISTLVGSNGNDVLTGSERSDTIAGAAPVGTPGVVTSPAGVDTIDGRAGNDTLLGGDSGSVTGDDGADTLVGGRSTSATTVIHGDEGGDTIVSGLGDDEVFGDAGSNTLAYASVKLGALTIVDRGTNGVTATLPNPGLTTAGGRTGSAESDLIHDDIGTLVGSNGNDVLTGSDDGDVLVGVAPAGTAGVAPGPAGNDIFNGGGGVDIMLAAEGNDTLDGGAGLDVFTAAAGDDTLLARDGVAETPSCGDGNDRVTSDPVDVPAADCETVDNGLAPPDTVKPKLTAKPALLRLGKGRRATISVACPNETAGCSGKLVIQTRGKIWLGKKPKKRYTLGTASFATSDGKAKKVTVRLSKRTLRLVKPGKSLKLRGVATFADTAANSSKKTLKLRLKRPR